MSLAAFRNPQQAFLCTRRCRGSVAPRSPFVARSPWAPPNRFTHGDRWSSKVGPRQEVRVLQRRRVPRLQLVPAPPLEEPQVSRAAVPADQQRAVRRAEHQRLRDGSACESSVLVPSDAGSPIRSQASRLARGVAPEQPRATANYRDNLENYAKSGSPKLTAEARL